MDDPQSQITQLQDANRSLIADRDRFQQMALLYQENLFQERLKYFTASEVSATGREGELDKLRTEWEQERVRERDEWERARVKEREQWEKALEAKTEGFAKKLAKLEQEWNVERGKERREWERKLEELKRSLEGRVCEGRTQNPNNFSPNSVSLEAVMPHPMVLTPEPTASPPPALSTSCHCSKPNKLLDVFRVSHDMSAPTEVKTETEIDASFLTMEPSSHQSRDHSTEHSSSPRTSIRSAYPDATASSTLLSTKKKKEQPKSSLSASRRAEYLSGTSLFAITPDYIPTSFSRNVLNRLYGAKTMGFEWISKDRKHKFMTPKYEWNPDMPRAPGEPGLLLITYDSVVEDSPWTLFYTLDTTKNVKWGYAGEYVCKEVGKFMMEEFEAQDDKVKKTWGKNVSERLANGPMLKMRARMTLRKSLHHEPTENEVDCEAKKITRKVSPRELTPQDVINSFISGEEHIKVMSLQCVDYDHSKARDFMSEQQRLDEEEEAERVRKKVRMETKGKVNGKPTKKRRRLSSVEAISDPPTDNEVVNETVSQTSKPRPKRRNTGVAFQPTEMITNSGKVRGPPRRAKVQVKSPLAMSPLTTESSENEDDNLGDSDADFDRDN